jgi:hypothetical protein
MASTSIVVIKIMISYPDIKENLDGFKNQEFDNMKPAHKINGKGFGIVFKLLD